MNDVLIYAILGLGAGAAYALIGQGLILTFRGTGVVNFAQGAIAMITAFTYAWLTNEGISIGVATLIALAFSAVIGAVIQRVVMKPLTRAPLLGKLVATLGLILVAEAAANLIFGDNFMSIPSLLPSQSVHFFGVTVGRDRLILLVVALVLAALLSLFSRRTPWGLLIRSAADSEEGVVILGYSLSTVASGTWILGSVLAGFAGIVVAPITGLNITGIILLVIPALAVTLLARFSSFWIVTIAGLLLGIGQSELARYWTISSPTLEGMQQALPFLLIIIVMVARGRSIPDRSTVAIGRPPLAPQARAHPLVVLGVVAAIIGVTSILSGTYQTAMAIAFVSAIVALSLVVLTGYVGQISLAQMTFAGLGTYFCAEFASSAGIPFPFPIILAALALIPCGIVLGLPALRVRGINLAVVTLGAAVAVNSLIFTDTSLTGGFNGIVVPSPGIFGYSLDGIIHPFRFAMLALLILLVCVVCVGWLRRGRMGLRMLAVRDNERAAAAEGVNVMRVKLLAFAIASFLAGLAGALFGYLYGHVSFDSYAPLASVTFVATAYIGGIASLPGAVIAGLISAGGPVFGLFASSASIEPYQLLISGLGVIVTAIGNPDGIAPYVNQHYKAFLGWLKTRADGPARVLSRTDAPAPNRGQSPASPARVPGPSAARSPREERVRQASRETLLEVRGLSVRYAGVSAVDKVDLTMTRGSFIGLIGPNGAGKTTFIDAICGFVGSTGDVWFAGRPVAGLPAHERSRLGLRRTFQTTELFDDLTIRENLLVPVARDNVTGVAVSVGEALELVGLADQADSFPRQLSNGERKLAGLARALRGRPDLLLLDEPAAGLDSAESQLLGDRMLSLLGLGISILLVDHDLDLIMRVCDRVDVLDRGRLLASGPPDEVRSNPLVHEAYIGGAATETPAEA
jgi:ABC-type branched-subunit amino acid transport system ATPase component/branched-subunit amino acid ABC-type transport system permease component